MAKSLLTLPILALCACSALTAPSTTELLKEDFENPESVKLAEAAKFTPAFTKNAEGKNALSGSRSLEIDAMSASGWTPLLTIPIKSGGGYKFSFKYKILEKSPSASVYAAMRSIDSDGKKNRLSVKNLPESKGAKNVVMGAVVPSSAKGEIEIISNGGARIILDDISVEKLEVDPRGAWMYDDDAFIAMRYKPTNFDFSGFDAPFLSYTKEEFFPFIDKYGQFKHKDWTDKIKSDGDFKKRAEEEKAFYEKIGDISRRDKYLGLVRDGKNYGATGRFRAEKIDGRWWLITPEGNLFYSFGITCAGNLDTTPLTDREFYFEDVSDNRFRKKNNYGGLHYYKGKKFDAYGFLERNLVAKYGDDYRALYGEVADERMKKWGFTTYGAWTQHYILRRGNVPYTLITNSKGRKTYDTNVKMYAYWHDFPDFFTPGFREKTMESVAKSAGLIKSPMCVGVFVDNELPWQEKTVVTIKALLGCPASQPGKIEFRKDLQKKYGEIEKLNAAWKASYKSWEDFLEKRDFAPNTAAARADMLAFEEKMYERYFKICREAVKAVSPDAMYIGCRFAWRNPLVERVASRYCDALSYNVYADNVTDFSAAKGAEDKPIIIGEFHFGNTDKGVYGGGLNARATAEERAQAFREYAVSAFENPKVVGAHWFQWFDLCTTGRFNEANYAIGFVDICDTPDYVIAKAARKLSKRMYDIRLRGGKSTRQSAEAARSVIDD